MPDYSNSCIYKLCCKDPSVKECYVGSTTNFTRRKCEHKRKSSSKSNLYVYKFIRDNGGWENWDMILIEKISVNDKKELHAKERECLEKLGAKLNSNIPNRSQKERMEEWYKDNPEYRKKYYLENKEMFTEQNRQYKLKNKERMAETDKKYQFENKEKIAERKAEKITCECGSIISRGALSNHMKKKKHADLMAELNAE